ncbi:hypothetical protein MYX06_03380 [Patescibacteria group bacterium AH-259-L05]|nr:hypothetical protein [Patescibacteria group bacterium AH-259-L05]
MALWHNMALWQQITIVALGLVVGIPAWCALGRFIGDTADRIMGFNKKGFADKDAVIAYRLLWPLFIILLILGTIRKILYAYTVSIFRRIGDVSFIKYAFRDLDEYVKEDSEQESVEQQEHEVEPA